MSANGSIKRDASGKWCFVVDVTSADGKRKQLRKRGFLTKKLAGEAMAIVVADQSRGLFVRPVKGTVNSYLIETWLPTKSRSLRPGTAFEYKKLLTHYVVPHIGHLELSKIDGGTLNALYELLLTNGRTGGSHRKGGLAPKTVRNVHGVLHKAFSDAVRMKRIAVNPCDAAEQPRADTPEMKTWTGEQIRQFMAHVAADRHVGVWHLLLTTGMRRGEILGLRWSDIDLGSNRLTVRSTTTQVDGRSLKGAPKTTDSNRTIAIDPGTVARLKAWKKLQAEERMLMGAGWRDSGGMLVTEPDGAALSPQILSKRFKALGAAACLPMIRLHDTRHSYATASLAAGVPVKVLSQRLGHADVGVTLKVYAHVMPGDDEAAAALAASAIMG